MWYREDEKSCWLVLLGSLDFVLWFSVVCGMIAA